MQCTPKEQCAPELCTCGCVAVVVVAVVAVAVVAVAVVVVVVMLSRILYILACSYFTSGQLTTKPGSHF